jgi:hypothetical protein
MPMPIAFIPLDKPLVPAEEEAAVELVADGHIIVSDVEIVLLTVDADDEDADEGVDEDEGDDTVELGSANVLALPMTVCV